MWSHLKEQGINLPSTDWKEINKKIIPVLRRMEQTGIKLDVPLINKIAQKIESECFTLESEVHEIAGLEFNLNSPSQMSEVLFAKLKLPTDDLKKTKSGISTAASELRKIVDEHEIIKPILQYRELSKLLSTYLKPLPLLVDDQSRLHTSYGQDTSTGRITSCEPNLQNIPIKGEWGGEIRSAFIADEGMVLISADYSQIELRVVSCLADDRIMKEAFIKGEDIHTKTASEIFGVDLKDVDPNQRRIAKTVNFGVLYGQSPYGLSQTLGIDQRDAASYIKRYFTVHCGIKEYCNRMIEKAHQDGYVETLFGYTRTLPNINSHQRNIADAEERMAINTPVQGTAAEILKLAMIKLEEELKNLKQPAKMLLTVHDEIVVEAPKSEAKKVANLIKSTMENIVNLCVPLKAEVGIGSNWAETKK